MDRYSVIVIEDDEQVATVIRVMLEETACVVLGVVKTLDEGIRLLAQAKPDAVILDLGLPDASGIQAVKKIVGRNAGVPIMVVTGSDELATEAYDAGASSVLCKPFDFQTMQERLLRMARKQRDAIDAGQGELRKWRDLVVAKIAIMEEYAKRHLTEMRETIEAHAKVG